MQDNSGCRIFCVGIHRAADKAGRFQTMIATHGQVPALRVGIPPAFNLSHAPPIDLCWVSVLFVASNHATLAADTLGHIEVKTVLFPWFERAARNAR